MPIKNVTEHRNLEELRRRHGDVYRMVRIVVQREIQINDRVVVLVLHAQHMNQ